MDGVTDAAFRSITAKHGSPDVTFTEFMPVERIVRGYDPELAGLRYSEMERPIVAQIYGNNPDDFYRVAHVVCALGFDGLDINMGCPAPNVASRGAGAGLIRTPDVAGRIIAASKAGIADWAAGQSLESVGLPPALIATVQRILDEDGRIPGRRQGIPVSVKTRLGYDRIVVSDWIGSLLSAGPAAISLHGRTLTQRYRGEANWLAIARAAELAQGSGTLLLGNGDLRSSAEAVARIRDSGVDGVLFGRAAMGHPWIFRAKDSIRESVLRGGDPTGPGVEVADRLAVMLEHAALFDRIRGNMPFRSIRKFLAAYCRGFPHAVELRRRLVLVDSVAEIETLLADAVCA